MEEQKIYGKSKMLLTVLIMAVLIAIFASSVYADGCFVDGTIYYKNGTPVVNDTKFTISIYNSAGVLVTDPLNPFTNGTGTRCLYPANPEKYKNVNSITCNPQTGDYVVVSSWDTNFSTAITEADYTGMNTSNTAATNCTPAGVGFWDCLLNITLTNIANPNVSITADQTSDTVVPGVNATYILNITNLAGANDSFTILNSTNITNLYLNETSISNLGAGDSWYVKLDLNNASDGFFTSNITVYSQSNTSVNDTIEINTSVVTLPVRGVSIIPNVTTVGVFNDTNATYLLNITNTGNTLDNFTLYNVTNATNALLNETTITGLASGASYFILLYVWDSLGGDYTTNVTARSDNDAAANATVSLNSTITEIIYTVSVTSTIPQQTIYNNTNATYLISITNTGTKPDNYTITNSTNATYVNLNGTSLLDVNPGQTIQVQLNVSDGVPGSYETNVTATSDNFGSVTNKTTVNTTIIPFPVRDVNISSNATTTDIMNYSYATYLLNITNNGNYADNFTISRVTNASTAVLNQTTILNLGSGQSFQVVLNVTNPVWGYFETTATVTSQNDGSANDNVVVATNVSEVLNTGLIMVADTTYELVGAGVNATYILNVTNQGNYPDSFNLTNSTNASFAQLNQTITPTIWMGESFFIELNVSNPTLGYFETNITAVSENNNSLNVNETVYTNVSQIILNVSIDSNTTYQDTVVPTPAVYLLNITNLGNGQDSFTLSRNTNATSAVFNQTAISNLAAGESAFVTLSVLDPISGSFQTNVTVVSDTASTANDTVNVTTNVTNTPPSQPTVDVTPNTPKTQNDLTCTVTGASVDPEGQPISYYYTWYKDGVWNMSTTNLVQTSYTLASGNTKKNEVWNCTVTPHDGALNGTAGFDTVTILNTAPTIDVNITPELPSTIENLTCSGIYTDVDGDAPSPVSYQFTGDYTGTGSAACSLISGNEYNCTANVSSTDTDAGDNITCVMTPNDGTTAGTTDSDWVQIAFVDSPTMFRVYLNETDRETVIITWTPVADATQYNLYWSENVTEMMQLDPYYATPNATTTLTNYTDENAASVTERYYRVASVKAPAFGLEPEIGAKSNLSVKAGANLISFPMIPDSYTLNDLIVPPSTSSYDRITRYTPGAGFQRTDYYGSVWKWWGFFDSIEPDKGYYFYPTKTSYTLPMAGTIFKDNRTVPISSGYNLIGWSSIYTKAINDTLTPPTDEDRISVYDVNEGWQRTDYYTGYGWFGKFDNFEPGKGYWFYPVGTGYTWEYDPDMA